MQVAWYHNFMCILSITSFILVWIAINSPSHGMPRYSLLSVTSGESGPSIWLGLGGEHGWLRPFAESDPHPVSCVRLNKNSTTTCSDFAYNPKYSKSFLISVSGVNRMPLDFSAISDAPVFVLQAPPGILRFLIILSAVLTTILMIYVVVGLSLMKYFDNHELY